MLSAPMQRTFKRSFDSLEKLFEMTESFFAREKIGHEHGFALNLAVEELFTNMVKYNAEGMADIDVRLEREDDRVTVVLTDRDADPFDPITAPSESVDKPLEERRPGKLGLFLVKKMMDRVEYRYEDRRSTITLMKRLR